LSSSACEDWGEGLEFSGVMMHRRASQLTSTKSLRGLMGHEQREDIF
jgi:hypothetical protein